MILEELFIGSPRKRLTRLQAEFQIQITRRGNKIEDTISTVEQLKDFVNLSPNEEKKLKHITQRHPMRVTPYYMSLIDWNDPYDPIRKMAIPSLEELDVHGSYDTSGEA